MKKFINLKDNLFMLILILLFVPSFMIGMAFNNFLEGILAVLSLMFYQIFFILILV